MSVWTEKHSQLASLVDPSAECDKSSATESEPAPIRAEIPSAIEISPDDSHSGNDLVTRPSASGPSEIDLRDSGSRSEERASLVFPDSHGDLDSRAADAEVEILDPSPLSDLTPTKSDDDSDGGSEAVQGNNKEYVEVIDVDENANVEIIGLDDDDDDAKKRASSGSSVIVGDSSASLTSPPTEFDTPPSNGQSLEEDDVDDAMDDDKATNGEDDGNEDDDDDGEEGMFTPDDQGSNDQGSNDQGSNAQTEARPFAVAVEDWRRDLELSEEDDELFQRYNALQFRGEAHRNPSVDSVGANQEVTTGQHGPDLDGEVEGSGLREPRPSAEWQNGAQDDITPPPVPELGESADHFAYEEVLPEESNVIDFYFSQASEANIEPPWEVFLPASDYRALGRGDDADVKVEDKLEVEDKLKENKELGSVTRTPKKHSSHVVHPLSAASRLRRELSFSTLSEVANSSTTAQCGSPTPLDSFSSSVAGTNYADDETSDLLSDMDAAIAMNGEPAQNSQDEENHEKASFGIGSDNVLLPESVRNETLPQEMTTFETKNDGDNDDSVESVMDENEPSTSGSGAVTAKQETFHKSYSGICRFTPLNEEEPKDITDAPTIGELNKEYAFCQDPGSVIVESEPSAEKFSFKITDVRSMAGVENLFEDKAHLKRKKESDDESPIATAKQFKTENAENVTPEAVRYAGFPSDVIPDNYSQKPSPRVPFTEIHPANPMEDYEMQELSPSAKEAPPIGFPSPTTPPDMSRSKTSPAPGLLESTAPFRQAESPTERGGSSSLSSMSSRDQRISSGFSPQDQRTARRQQRRSSPYSQDAATHRLSKQEASVLANRAKWADWNPGAEPRFTPNRNLQPTLMSPTSSPPFGAFPAPSSQPAQQQFRFSFRHNPDATILQQSSGSRGKFEFFPSPPYTSEPTKVIPWYAARALPDPSVLTKYFMAELCQRAEQGEQLLGAYLLGLRACCPETFSEKRWNTLRCNLSRKSRVSVVITNLVPASPPQENDYVRLQLESMRQTKTVTFPVNPAIHPCHMLALVASLTLLLVQWRRPTSAYRGFTHLWRVGTADFLHLAVSSLGLDRLHADPNFAWQCFPAKEVCREFGHLACSLELDLEVFDILLQELDRARRSKDCFRSFFEELARQCDLLDATSPPYDAPDPGWDDQDQGLSPGDVRHLLNARRARQHEREEDRPWGRDRRWGQQQTRKWRRSTPYPMPSRSPNQPPQPPSRHPDHTYDRGPDFGGNVRGASRFKTSRARASQARSQGTPRPWGSGMDGAGRVGVSPRWGFRAEAWRESGEDRASRRFPFSNKHQDRETFTA